MKYTGVSDIVSQLVFRTLSFFGGSGAYYAKLYENCTEPNRSVLKFSSPECLENILEGTKILEISNAARLKMSRFNP